MTMLDKVLQALEALNIDIQFDLHDVVDAVSRAITAYSEDDLKPNEAAIYAILTTAYREKIAANKDLDAAVVDKVLQGLGEQIG